MMFKSPEIVTVVNLTPLEMLQAAEEFIRKKVPLTGLETFSFQDPAQNTGAQIVIRVKAEAFKTV